MTERERPNSYLNDTDDTHPFRPPTPEDFSRFADDTRPVMMTYHESAGDPFPVFEDDATVVALHFEEPKEELVITDQNYWDVDSTFEQLEEAASGAIEFAPVAYLQYLHVCDPIIVDEKILKRMSAIKDPLLEFQLQLETFWWLFFDGFELMRIFLEPENDVRKYFYSRGRDDSSIETILSIRAYGLVLIARRQPLPFPTNFIEE